MVAVPSIGRAAQPNPQHATREADATRRLYEQYARQIYAYCLHQLRNKEEAEDATQSTFLNAFRGLQRGIDPEFETAWLYKIAQNVCLTRQRSTTRRRRVEAPGDLDAMQDVLPAREVDSHELIGLPEALNLMPEQQRRALLLREWQGLSYKEIADELDLSQAAVETLLFRARRSLANGLSDEEKSSLAQRLQHGGDAGSVLAVLKSLLVTGGAKVAATVATVAATSAVVASPAARHVVSHAAAVDAPPAKAAVRHLASAPAPAPRVAPLASSHVQAVTLETATPVVPVQHVRPAQVVAAQSRLTVVRTPPPKPDSGTALLVSAPVAPAPAAPAPAPAPARAPAAAAAPAPAAPAPRSKDTGSGDNGNGKNHGNRADAPPPAEPAPAPATEAAPMQTAPAEGNGRRAGNDHGNGHGKDGAPAVPVAVVPVAPAQPVVTDATVAPAPAEAPAVPTTDAPAPTPDSVPGNGVGNGDHGSGHDKKP